MQLAQPARRHRPRARIGGAGRAHRQVTERALEAMDRGDYESARVDLLHLAAETPDSSEVQQRLGTVFQLEGRLAEAETSFKAALKRDPEYVEALIGLGQVEAQKGDTASAFKRFESAIEIDPHRSKAHACLGQLLETTNKLDDALAEYYRALEFDPNNPDLGLRIAAINLAQNEPDQALSRLDQVIELASENGEARTLRGRAHLARASTSRWQSTTSEQPSAGSRRGPTSIIIWHWRWKPTTNRRRHSALPSKLSASPRNLPMRGAFRSG